MITIRSFKLGQLLVDYLVEILKKVVFSVTVLPFAILDIENLISQKL